MKIALAQLNLTVGNITANAAKIVAAYRDAVAQGVDLVLTPELSLAGYQLEDLVQQNGFCEAVWGAAQNLAAQTGAAGLIIGLPVRLANRIYNAAALLVDGKIQTVQYKHHLANYGVYDECRYFAPGPMPAVMHFRGRKLGVMICEDFWHSDVPQHLAQQGAEIYLTINGSVVDGIDRHLVRHASAAERAQFAKIPFVYCNLIGGRDEDVFDGASFALDATGKLLGQAPRFQEFLGLVHWQPSNLTTNLPLLDLSIPAEADYYAACTLALRDYVHKSGFKSVLLGLSGGVDSALVAAIAVDALGVDHVRAVMLPSPYTSQASLDDAGILAKNLGIKLSTIPIGAMVELVAREIDTNTGITPSGLAHENLQSRLRGLTLMTLSNQTGALLLTTGNKSELAVGYATLYGDMCGAFNPIKDLYKGQVYKLCHWRNTQGRGEIPARILTRAPSAELRPDQTDQDSLPPYDTLDGILHLYLEGQQSPAEIIAHGFDPALVARVIGMVNRAEYKRRQAATGPKLSPRAFGRDRRWPLHGAAG